jgi:hypothetical protein
MPPRQSISWPWFIVGLVVLTASLIVFFWAFSLGDLSPSRVYLLRWLLPLASGFICGCFAGSLRVSGPIGALAIGATGGFAIWILTFFFLADPSRPQPGGINRLQAARMEIVGLRGTWETMGEGNPSVISRVLSEGPVLAEQILRIRSGLNLGQQIDREEWAGYAYFMAADAAHVSKLNSERDPYIDRALEHLSKAKSLVAEADAQYAAPGADQYIVDLQKDITRCYDRERIEFLTAMTYALDVFGRHKYTEEQVRSLVSSINQQRLEELEINLRFTPYVSEILFPQQTHVGLQQERLVHDK